MKNMKFCMYFTNFLFCIIKMQLKKILGGNNMKQNFAKGLYQTAGLVSLCAITIGSLSGCSTSKTYTDAEVETEDTEHVAESGSAPEIPETSTPAVHLDDGSIRADLTSVELADLMGNGINLGNTMEAYGHLEPGIGAEVSEYETLWGQPVTTEAMIASMKAAGFDSIRIPIAWTNAMDYESGDYTIGEDYLDRIEELINYARNQEMYVIINDHWDGGWWGMFGSAAEETRKEALKMYTSMWTQIAERYRDYSDYLIFESGNEELGDRLNDIDVCKDSDTLSEDECYETANLINQTFVDTIRSTGGNNTERFLLIAGYNTDIDCTCDDRFIMPADSAADKLLISVHYYTPWNYCGSTSTDHWGTQKDYEEQNSYFEKMNKFQAQGYGVVIGEYAVLPREDGSLKNNICDFTNNLLDNCDYYGYCPMLWDCSNLFIRSELKFCDTDIADLYLNRSYASQSSLSADEIKVNAKNAMDQAHNTAPEKFEKDIDLSTLDDATAWIMFNSKDWSIGYSSGDVYNPNDKTDGIVSADTSITGAGTYTVSLDFTGTNTGYATGTAFLALGISNGELFYPDYIIDIKEIKINGEPYEIKAAPYTVSDDGKCTRVNFYNEWVSDIPSDARTTDKKLSDVSATLLDNDDLSEIRTIEITFDYKP